MRWPICALILLTFTAPLHAQNAKPDADKLLKETEDKLKDAQDRRAQLADQNTKLAAQIADLKKTIETQSAQIVDLKTQAAGFADKTLFLTTHYTAWKQFIAANPAVKVQWEFFEKTAATFIPQSPLFIDPNWPLPEDQ